MGHVHAIACACLCIAMASASRAQNSKDKVDQYVEAEMERQKIPGLALGVYRKGTIVKVRGYGLANVELNVPVKPETIFQSGSVGKQFTATAVMMLVQEGKLGLGDSVRKYFPEAPGSWANITIMNLLSHTSGLSEYESPDKTKPGGPINLQANLTEDELVKIIEKFPMDSQPGEKWAYRNTNYVLLGVIIHKVTGQFYGDFLQDRIFRPLEMTSTCVISEADIVPNRSAGYRLVKGELKNQEWVSPFFNSTADGALYFNVLDLAKWDGALYTEKLVRKSSLDQMWTVAKLNDGKPNPSNYGFAWEINQVNGHKVIEHGGAWQGFTTYISRYVDEPLTIVVLTNLDSADSNPSKIAHQVAGLYNPELTPPVLKVIEDKEPGVTALVHQTLRDIVAGRVNLETFTTEQQKDWTPEQVKEIGDFLNSLGVLKSLELVERTQPETGRAYKYRAIFTNRTMLLTMNLDKNGKIADLGLEQE